MHVVHTINEVRAAVAAARKAGKTIGFVPTMGALHVGHGSLVHKAHSECGYVVVSIFVNPTQFGPTEDFSKYPRTLDEDAKLCAAMGADCIFAPAVEEMYPEKNLSWVDVEKLGEGLCGASRPGHFRGVTTVCTKLFHIVLPDVAYFGQKDAQQAAVLCRMVSDLNFPMQIKVCPIVREPDGLAMSSRNRYLSADDRRRAVCLYQAMSHCKQQVEKGVVSVSELVSQMDKVLTAAGGTPDYISIVDAKSLQSLQVIDRDALVAIACRVGPARLIDNMLIFLNPIRFQL
ncbi:MAG: pantoate--beta-alanine ligase [Anaerohalosphaeraceae bacterium]